MIPTNTVSANGVGDISDDQLNTYVQTNQTAAQLRTFIGVSGMCVVLQGIASPGDGLAGMFQWNATSIAADDDLNVIVPYSVTEGAWIRLQQSFSYGNLNIAKSGVFTNTQGNVPNFVLLNGINPITEFSNWQGGNNATDALAVGVAVPSTSTVFGAFGLAAFCTNASTATAAAAGFFSGRSTAAGVTVWGINPAVNDSGFASTIQGAEIDVGASNAATVAAGVNVTSGFSANVTNSTAFSVGSGGTYPWQWAFVSHDGAAVNGLWLGAVGTTASSNSQSALFWSRDAGNVSRLCNIYAVATASAANLFLEPAAGGSVLLGGNAAVETGNLDVGKGLGVWGTFAPASQPTISGSRGSATAAVLASLLTALAATGLIVDGTSA